MISVRRGHGRRTRVWLSVALAAVGIILVGSPPVVPARGHRLEIVSIVSAIACVLVVCTEKRRVGVFERLIASYALGTAYVFVRALMASSGMSYVNPGTFTLHLVGVLILFMLIFVGLSTGVDAIRGKHRRGGAFVDKPHCLQCGYCLVGLVQPRCPECGTPFDPALLEPKPRVGD